VEQSNVWISFKKYTLSSNSCNFGVTFFNVIECVDELSRNANSMDGFADVTKPGAFVSSIKKKKNRK
jgi:hypothetical protein